MQSRLEMLEECPGLVALGRELKEQPPGSLNLVIPHNAEAIFLEQSIPLQWHQPEGKQEPCPQESI